MSLTYKLLLALYIGNWVNCNTAVRCKALVVDRSVLAVTCYLCYLPCVVQGTPVEDDCVLVIENNTAPSPNPMAAEIELSECTGSVGSSSAYSSASNSDTSTTLLIDEK